MLPKIKVKSVRKIYDDGDHNAFTDLAAFRGRLYLTFRTCPDGHMVYTTSRIVVMCSSDEGASWEQVHTFSVPTRDVRDPHFLVFNDSLFVYTGTWFVEEPLDINHHLGYCVQSNDGAVWSDPTMLEGTWGHYIWRAAAPSGAPFGGKAYLCGRRRRGFKMTDDTGDGTAETESAMMESDDGIVWQPVGFFQVDYGDETAFVFDERGGVMALSRGGGDRNAQVCRSVPPYREWNRVDLGRNIGGPMLARWGDRFLIGGRKTIDGHGPLTAIGWLEGLGSDETPHIVEGPELPSGGDTSYPGFHALSDTEGLLSYYSSHEGSDATSATSATGAAGAIGATGEHGDTSIYMAELTLG
jgi:hypothetical protein